MSSKVCTLSLWFSIANGSTSSSEVFQSISRMVEGWWATKREREERRGILDRFSWTVSLELPVAKEYRLDQLNDRDNQWETTIRIHQGARVLLGVRMEMEPSEGEDFRFFVEPPQFVRESVRNLELFRGPTRLLSEAIPVRTRASVEALHNAIRYPGRSVPIVVVASRSNGDYAFPDLPSKLAWHLAGVATVYDLAAREAYDLTSLVGKQSSCFDGGVRLYFPRTISDGDGVNPEAAPLWTRHLLGEMDLVRLQRALMNSCLRWQRESNNHPLELRDDAWEILRTRSELDRLGVSTLPEARTLIERLREQVARHEAQQKDYEGLLKVGDDERAELIQLVAKFRAKAEALEAAHDATNTSTPEANDNETPFRTAEDAVSEAKNKFSDVLHFDQLKVEVKSSEANHLYQYLACFADLFRELNKPGSLGKSKGEWLEECVRNRLGKNPSYKTGRTSLGYTSPFDGRKREVRDRLHLVDGAPADSRSIYWAEESYKGKTICILLRYGPHL